ncbi:MAG: TonB-dependent receptor, partial [Phascolarctobacterium sp.]|nr:TonB-dependent receptor [Phascolarctobacterium sp.]
AAVASVGFVMSASAEEVQTYEMGPVVVVGDKGVLPGGYVSTDGSAGLLGYQDTMSLPFQQNNITEKAIEIFGANPSEASTAVLVNSPSIRTAGSTVYNDYSLRGQNANAYQFRINGVPGMLSQTNIPMTFFEKVEITSGASVGIYGVAAKESAGGSINLVTKKAGKEDINRVNVGFAGRGTGTIGLDVSRRFGKDKEQGIRVNISGTNGETGIKNEKVRNNVFSINYDRETKHAETNIFAGYRDTKTKEAMRYFYMGNKNLTRLPSAPSAKNNYAFDGEQVGMKTYMAVLNHVQKFNDSTKMFVNAGWAYNDGYSYRVPQGTRLDIINDAGDVSRNMRNEPFAIRNTYLQAGVQHNWKVGVVENKTVAAYDMDWYAAQWGTSGSNGKITGNIYKNNISYDKFTQIKTGPIWSGKSKYNGWSLINTSTIGKLDVDLGVHHHQSTVTATNHSVTKSDATSPLYGLVYKPTDKLSIFANHTESFQEGSIVTMGTFENGGDVLSPTKTKQNEFGIKYKNKGFMTSISYFDMEKEATFDRTIDGKTWRTIDGELNYKGVEFSIGGQIAPKWSLNGGLLYINSDYKNHSTYEGRQVLGTSKWSGVGVLQYAPDENTNIFGRAVFTGKAPIYTEDNRTLEIGSSVVYDLGVRYKTKINRMPVTLTATCFNLFGKDYWLPRATTQMGILGNPRTFAIGASFDI